MAPADGSPQDPGRALPPQGEDAAASDGEARARRAGEAFAEAVRVMDRLRAPGQDAWVAAQTHESLVRYLVEESAEVLEAIESPDGVDRPLLREELGDLLLQILFHARLAQEVPAAEGGFDVVDVVREQTEKQVRRHPHVFSEASSATDLEELTRRWDRLKQQEKPGRTGPFDGIPPRLPALARAEKAVNKAAKAGLPFPEAVAFGRADLDEPRTALSPESVADPDRDEAAERAVGETLLGLVITARGLGVDPERALRRTVDEYVRAAQDAS